jgi:hypothetical protein
MADFNKRSEEKKMTARAEGPGASSSTSPPIKNSDLVVDKMIRVMDLLEERTRELEKRIQTAEVMLNCLEADRMKGSCKSHKGPLKGKTSMVTHHGQGDGGYQCRANKTMLMFCIIDLHGHVQ